MMLMKLMMHLECTDWQCRFSILVKSCRCNRPECTCPVTDQTIPPTVNYSLGRFIPWMYSGLFGLSHFKPPSPYYTPYTQWRSKGIWRLVSLPQCGCLWYLQCWILHTVITRMYPEYTVAWAGLTWLGIIKSGGGYTTACYTGVMSITFLFSSDPYF